MLILIQIRKRETRDEVKARLKGCQIGNWRLKALDDVGEVEIGGTWDRACGLPRVRKHDIP
jgi:hypothetical protein